MIQLVEAVPLSAFDRWKVQMYLSEVTREFRQVFLGNPPHVVAKVQGTHSNPANFPNNLISTRASWVPWSRWRKYLTALSCLLCAVLSSLNPPSRICWRFLLSQILWFSAFTQAARCPVGWHSPKFGKVLPSSSRIKFRAKSFEGRANPKSAQALTPLPRSISVCERLGWGVSRKLSRRIPCVGPSLYSQLCFRLVS